LSAWLSELPPLGPVAVPDVTVARNRWRCQTPTWPR